MIIDEEWLAKRRQWLIDRKTYIGGSDIAAIVGASPYKTALQLYLDKISPEIDESDPTGRILWGILQEDIIAKQYSKKTGYNIEVAPDPIRHPQYPFLAVNIDRWADDRRHVLEVKTVDKDTFRYTWQTNHPELLPEYYETQVYWTPFICNVPKVEAEVLIGGNQDKTYIYERNIKIEKQLSVLALNFWNNNVLARVPPEPTTLDDCTLLYPKGYDNAIIADDEIVQEVRALQQLKNEQTTLTDKISQSAMKIKSFMKDCDALTDEAGKLLITWRNSAKGTRIFNVK